MHRLTMTLYAALANEEKPVSIGIPHAVDFRDVQEILRFGELIQEKRAFEILVFNEAITSILIATMSLQIHFVPSLKNVLCDKITNRSDNRLDYVFGQQGFDAEACRTLRALFMTAKIAGPHATVHLEDLNE